MPNPSSARRLALAAMLASAVVCVAGCGEADRANGQTQARPAAAAIAKGVVDQDGGLVRLAAPRDGVITQVLVQEGDRVVQGQALALLDARQARLTLAAAEAEAGDRAAQLSIARARLDAAQRDAGRLGRLASQDAATRQEADQAQTAAQIAKGEYDQAIQVLKGAQARRQLEAYEVGVREVRATAAGRVLRRTAVAGASVATAQPLFVIETNAPRVVRAEVDETFADRVRPGMAATVTREFDEARRYPARVLRVSDSFGAPALNDDPTAAVDTRVVSVVLALDGQPGLKLGQRVLVRFGP